MNIDPQEIAGKPCPGCGSGDQIEILEDFPEGVAIMKDGEVYHSIDCLEEVRDEPRW